MGTFFIVAGLIAVALAVGAVLFIRFLANPDNYK